MKYYPPKQAQENAKKVLRWKQMFPNEVQAMTPVGWARARQLARGDGLSLDIVKRIAAFARHEKNKSINPKYRGKPWKDNGYVAWLGWGGDSGINWAQNIVHQLNHNI